MDPTTTVDEITTSLQNRLGDDVSGIRIATPKVGRYGSLYTTVTMHRIPARKLIAEGRVQIGLLSCEVRERIVVPRCFKCWEFGHRSHNCKQDVKPETCLNCGEEGHRAKDCKNNPFCIKCRKTGHRADQTRCPHFRLLVLKGQS
nr:unnamed protein product [Callosobruchus analis]